jgi:Cu/Ag efflux protein CusF
MSGLSSVHPGKFSPMSTKSLTFAPALAALAILPLASLSAAALPGVADADDNPEIHATSADAPDDTPLASGRIVAIDPAAAKITLDHRPLPLLPEGGVRVFSVENPAILKGLSAGDRVRFEVERDGRRFVLTHLENSN